MQPKTLPTLTDMARRAVDEHCSRRAYFSPLLTNCTGLDTDDSDVGFDYDPDHLQNLFTRSQSEQQELERKADLMFDRLWMEATPGIYLFDVPRKKLHGSYQTYEDPNYQKMRNGNTEYDFIATLDIRDKALGRSAIWPGGGR